MRYESSPENVNSDTELPFPREQHERSGAEHKPYRRVHQTDHSASTSRCTGAAEQPGISAANHPRKGSGRRQEPGTEADGMGFLPAEWELGSLKRAGADNSARC